MKKIILTSTALTGIVLSALFAQRIAQADNTTSTTTNISVTSGGLNIDPLSSIDFGSILLNGKDQIVPPTNPTAPTLILHDYRGATTGWHLQASYKKDAKLSGGLTLSFKPTADQGITPKSQLTLSGDAQDIDSLTTADTTKPNTTITLNPSIEVPAKAIASTYNATIVWNAIDGAPA